MYVMLLGSTIRGIPKPQDVVALMGLGTPQESQGSTLGLCGLPMIDDLIYYSGMMI
jgi:hypothetical protein